MSAVAGALSLLGMAAAPAGIALFLIRRRLGAAGGRFWTPFGVGLFVLTAVAVGLIAWAAAVSEPEINACRGLAAGERLGCEDAGLLVGVAGIGSILTLAMFVAGGLLAHIWLRRRGRPDPGAPLS